MGFIHFLFKGLYHLHYVDFKIFFLCFNCVGIARACCSRLAGLSWSHTALVIVDCVLMLVSRHLHLRQL